MLYSADIEIKAYVDKTVVAQNQQFTLSVEMSGPDAQAAGNPKLPDTNAFAYLLGSGSSQNIQFINGKMSVSKTISYHFMATEAGDFTIGPVTIVHKNETYQTDPIQIMVQKSAAQAQAQTPTRSSDRQAQSAMESSEDLYIRAEADKRTVYPNEPVILAYKIYTKVNVTPAGISKLPGTAGFWVEEFDLPQQLAATSEVIDGQKYTVATFKKMALFPTSPGEKTIEPLGFDCDVRAQRKQPRDPFDSFFNDSFFFGNTKRITLLSNPVKINVIPFPEEGKPADFSGATGSFKISASVDKESAKTNDAVTFKVTVSGTGNIRTLPEPDVQIPPDFETYPPKISESVDRKGAGISGSRTYEYVLIPRNPGMQKIRPIRFCYFDPHAKSYKTIQTRELTVNVSQGDQSFTVVPEGRSRTAVEYLGKDIRFIVTAIPRFRRQGAAPVQAGVIWVVLVLPLGALGLASVYQKHLQRLQGDAAYARGRAAGRAAKKHLAKARSMVDPNGSEAFYAEVSRALSSFVGNKLNISEAGMLSADVRKQLTDRNVHSEVIEDYFDCLAVCDRMRFSPTGADEAEMKAFLKRVAKAITDLERQIK